MNLSLPNSTSLSNTHDRDHLYGTKSQVECTRRRFTRSPDISSKSYKDSSAATTGPDDDSSSFDGGSRLKIKPSRATTIPFSPSTDETLFLPLSTISLSSSKQSLRSAEADRSKSLRDELSLPQIKLRMRPPRRGSTPFTHSLEVTTGISRITPSTFNTPPPKIFLPFLPQTKPSHSQNPSESKAEKLNQSPTPQLTCTAQVLDPHRHFRTTPTTDTIDSVQDRQRKTKRAKRAKIHSTPRSPPPLLVPSIDFAIISATRLESSTPPPVPAYGPTYFTTPSPSSLITTDANMLSPKKRIDNYKSETLLTPIVAKPKAMRLMSNVSSRIQTTTTPMVTNTTKSTLTRKDDPLATTTPCLSVAPMVNIHTSIGYSGNVSVSASSLSSSRKCSAFSISSVEAPRRSPPISQSPPASPFRRIVSMKFDEDDVTLGKVVVSLK